MPEVWVHRDGCTSTQTQPVMKSRGVDEIREERQARTKPSGCHYLRVREKTRHDVTEAEGPPNTTSEGLGKRFNEGGQVDGQICR